MKIIKKFFTVLLCVIVLSSYVVVSQNVSNQEALIVAKNVISSAKSRSSYDGIRLEKLEKSEEKYENIYIFNNRSGGFVILSKLKNSYPVLAYSDNGYIDIDESKWAPAFKEMIDNYIYQLDEIIANEYKPSSNIIDAWDLLLSDKPLVANTRSVSPLLVTAWNQGCGYNAQCPVDAAGPCGRVYAGCVATAMGQVIRHHEHPVSGIGSQCYTHHVYGELCADFESTVYDYASMPNNSANAEVAKLLYHCGVSVFMGYSPSGSGAYSSQVPTALRDFFNYTNHLLLSKSAYNDAAWHRILQNELNNNRPMYYSGSGTGGHAFVVDGYQATNHYHVDWGWGGSHNGYFYLTALNPGSMNFNDSQRALVGVTPKPDFSGLDVSSSVELTCATPVSADISTGTSNVNYYKNTWPAAVGKELVYHFTTTLPGRIRVKIDNFTGGNVNVFLLSHPHQDSLIVYGNNGFIIDDTQPATYWIAVEGVNGAEPSFDIEVICPTIEADLIVENQYVSHEYVESDLQNVVFKSTVRNIGNTATAPVDIEYFISDDESFDFATYIYWN